MKVLEINSVNYSSTGNIMLNVAKAAQHNGIDVYYACANSRANLPKLDEKTILIGNRFFRKIHHFFGDVFGFSGFFSFFSTIAFLLKVKKISPNLIHIHNLHGDFINIPILFYFIKRNNIPVIWTLHDCWSFTGRCPYFDFLKCNRWMNGCFHCPYPKSGYPSAKIDTSKILWKLKRILFTGVHNMTIVTPSQWLAGLVKKSFLNEYPVKVINNGIDLNIFKPIMSNFRFRYGLFDHKIVLGVAFGWERRKGLDVFIELQKLLPPNYRIVLVGTSDKVDAIIPPGIISIHHTQNQKELVEIYSAADVFVNPTREENFPTVNMEALACGTPVVTFKTGGSPEIVDESCGSIVPYDDVDAMGGEIQRICENHLYSREQCLARAKLFDMNKKFEEYVEFYKKSCIGV